MAGYDGTGKTGRLRRNPGGCHHPPLTTYARHAPLIRFYKSCNRPLVTAVAIRVLPAGKYIGCHRRNDACAKRSIDSAGSRLHQSGRSTAVALSEQPFLSINPETDLPPWVRDYR